MMVGNETALPYQRPALLKALLGKTPGEFDAVRHLNQSWFETNKIDLRLDTIVTQFNLERHLAVLSTGQAIEFRKACLATGSRARRPQVAGGTLGNVLYPRSLRDVLAMREIAETERDIVVIGGGCVAVEAAAALSQMGKPKVTMVHRGRHLLSRLLDEESAAWFTGYFGEKGIKLMLGETLNGFEGRTVLRNVQTKGGTRFSAGLAIVAFGTEMNLSLVQGTPLSYPKGTPVNEFLETDEKGVFAVGDIALYPDRVFGGVRRIDHLSCAVEQGRVAGANMTGKKRQKFDWMPHYTTTIFDLKFDFIGDFSRPPTRVELEGDRSKKKFIASQFQLTAPTGAVLCNQPEEKVEAAKARLREFPRQIKKVVV